MEEALEEQIEHERKKNVGGHSERLSALLALFACTMHQLLSAPNYVAFQSKTIATCYFVPILL